jgi:hypothetical protein
MSLASKAPSDRSLAAKASSLLGERSQLPGSRVANPGLCLGLVLVPPLPDMLAVWSEKLLAVELGRARVRSGYGMRLG